MRGRGRDGGFTLLEVLVAFLIAAMALAVLVRGAVDGAAAGATAARYAEALSRARSRLAAAAGSPVPGEQSGDDGGGYRWRVRVAPVLSGAQPGAGEGAPVLYAVSVAVSWGGDGGERAVQLETRRLGLSGPRPP